jgi:hypothetical protein
MDTLRLFTCLWHHQHYTEHFQQDVSFAWILADCLDFSVISALMGVRC